MGLNKGNLMEDRIEKYIRIYGEEYRKLIEDTLLYLDERKTVWGVDNSFEESYIACIVFDAENPD